MATITTNRDLYTAISSLIERERTNSYTLENYLSGLWSIVRESRSSAGFSPGDFFELLSRAFTTETPTCDIAWTNHFSLGDSSKAGFVGWERLILRQVVDLHDMAKAGILENELLYFGVSSPRGSTWYNFDPCGYLECATAGWCGGWQPGDTTGREYVSGPVAVVAEDGSIESHDPKELENPIVEMPSVSWDSFRDFLWCGQIYE